MYIDNVKFGKDSVKFNAHLEAIDQIRNYTSKSEVYKCTAIALFGGTFSSTSEDIRVAICLKGKKEEEAYIGTLFSQKGVSSTTIEHPLAVPIIVALTSHEEYPKIYNKIVNCHYKKLVDMFPPIQGIDIGTGTSSTNTWTTTTSGSSIISIDASNLYSASTIVCSGSLSNNSPIYGNAISGSILIGSNS